MIQYEKGPISSDPYDHGSDAAGVGRSSRRKHQSGLTLVRSGDENRASWDTVLPTGFTRWADVVASRSQSRTRARRERVVLQSGAFAGLQPPEWQEQLTRHPVLPTGYHIHRIDNDNFHKHIHDASNHYLLLLDHNHVHSHNFNHDNIFDHFHNHIHHYVFHLDDDFPSYDNIINEHYYTYDDHIVLIDDIYIDYLDHEHLDIAADDHHIYNIDSHYNG